MPQLRIQPSLYEEIVGVHNDAFTDALNRAGFVEYTPPDDFVLDEQLKVLLNEIRSGLIRFHTTGTKW